MVNVTGVISGVLKNTDKLGGLLGFLTGSPQGFGDVQSSLENIMKGNVHLPDIAQTFGSMAAEPYVKNGILVWICGYIMQELKLPILSKYGAPLSKFGLAYAAGAAAQKLLWNCTHSDQGSDPTKRGGSNFGGMTATYPY